VPPARDSRRTFADPPPAPVRWKALAAWFLFVLFLAVLGRWQVARARADRCNLDGSRITPIYRVDLMAGEKVERSFCCLRCARDWPQGAGGGYWRVRDEVTGQLLDAATACFVESSVVTVPSRQCRIHVFKDWAAAMAHAAEYGGKRVPNPLAGRTGSQP
jgi:hypothetical protein